MFDKGRLLTAALAPALIGAGIVGAAYGAGEQGIAPGPAHCDIEVTEKGGMYALEGILYANVDVSGTYRFSVVSVGGSGNTNIRQGGAFTAASGDEATLGRVMLGGSGAAYEATLEITTFGETVACTERVGART